MISFDIVHVTTVQTISSRTHDLFWTNKLSAYLLKIIKGRVLPAKQWIMASVSAGESSLSRATMKSGHQSSLQRQSPVFCYGERWELHATRCRSSVVCETTWSIRFKSGLYIGIWGIAQHCHESCAKKLSKERRGNHCNTLQCKWETLNPRRLHVDHHLSIH